MGVEQAVCLPLTLSDLPLSGAAAAAEQGILLKMFPLE